MKFKKLLGVALSVAMLSTMVTFPAKADSDFTVTDKYTADGWGSANDTKDADGNKGNVTMVTTADYSHSGNYSLLMQFPETKLSGPFRAQDSGHAVKADTQYTMGCWINGNYTTGTFYIRLGWEDYLLMSPHTTPIETTEDGWKHYEMKFTPSKDYTNQVWLVAEGLDSNQVLLFDDVYLYEGDSTENMIANGGFEKNVPVVENKISAASSSIFGWSMVNHNGATNKGLSYFQASNKVARTGSQSLYYHRDGSDCLMAIQHGGVPAGKYTLTFYAKGQNTGLDWLFEWKKEIQVSSMTSSSAGDGWTKYTTTFELSASVPWIRLLSWGGINIYIDDISLTAEGSDVNLFKNGSFEDSYVYEYGAPVSLVAYPTTTAGTGVVSWRNPGTSDITSEVLKVNGEVFDFTPVTTSEGMNQVVLTGLEEYKEYECELSITSGNKTVTKTVTLIPDHQTWNNYAGNQAIEPWEFNRFDTEAYADAVLSLDKQTKYSGNSSMQIQCMRPNGGANAYAQLSQKVTLEKNKTYQFSFMTKYVRADAFNVQGCYNTGNGWLETPAIAMSGSANWTQKTYQIDAAEGAADDGDTYEKTIVFNIPTNAVRIWLDDIAINPMADGEVDTSVNLIKNGGFEYDDWSISSVDYKLMDGDVEIGPTNALVEGKILPVVNFRNVNADDLHVTVLSAVYEDGRLIGCNFAEQDVPKLKYALSSTGVGAAVEVPTMKAGSDYELKVMVWDNLGNLKPLAPATGL